MSDQSTGPPASFSGQARLFPLPNLVMFPSNLLPLHIFESRYREMLEDSLEGDQLITIATLKPGFDHDYSSRPPIAPIVCIGRVTAHQKTEQGTYCLTLVGLQRARIEHEIEPVRSFRRAHVELINDQLAESADGRQVGLRLADQIAKTLPSAAELAEHFIQGKVSLASLTDIIAFHLPLEVDVKLQLLAEPDVVARARTLLEFCPPNERPNSDNPQYPGNFSNN